MNITNETNLYITEYLRLTFNVKTGKYYLYRKQNNNLLFIHKQSNHAPSIIKRIPAMSSKGLPDIFNDISNF